MHNGTRLDFTRIYAGVIGSDVPWLDCPASNTMPWVITERVARYCFHHVCLCVCLSVCPANILVFYFSAIRRDIDLKCIQYTYWVVLNSLKKLTFIG